MLVLFRVHMFHQFTVPGYLVSLGWLLIPANMLSQTFLEADGFMWVALVAAMVVDFLVAVHCIIKGT